MLPRRHSLGGLVDREAQRDRSRPLDLADLADLLARGHPLSPEVLGYLQGLQRLQALVDQLDRMPLGDQLPLLALADQAAR
jgi:hypothetical protein